MNYSDYITTESDQIIANTATKITYSGYLKDTSNKIYIRYGMNNWNNINEVEMNQTPNGYLAQISIPSDSKEINFSFRNEKRMWDNNYGKNYSFKVMPPELIVEEEEEASPTFFNDDFLLAYNLNKEISKQKYFVGENKEETKENKIEEVVEKENKVEKIEEQEEDKKEDDFNYMVSEDGSVVKKENAVEIEEKVSEAAEQKLSEIKEKMFAKAKENILDIQVVEVEDVKTENLENSQVYYHSDIPYAKLFKEAKVEHVQDLINEISREEKTDFVFKPARPYARMLRKMANEKLLKLEIEREENNFLVVAPYSETMSFRATVKRIQSIITRTFERIQEMLSKRMGFGTNKI